MTDAPSPPPPPSAGEGGTPPGAPQEPTPAGTSDDPSSAPPPPTATAPRPVTPPFARSSTDKVLGGVAGAIAGRIALEPVAVRVVLVVLAIAGGGIVVPAYLLAWALIARDDDPSPRVYDQVVIREGGVLMWVIATVLVIALVGGISDPFGGPGDAFPLLPLALIGIGVALWSRGDRGAAAASGTWPRTDPPPPPTTRAFAGVDHPSAAGAWPTAATQTTDSSTGSDPVQTDTRTTAPGWPSPPAPATGAPPPPRAPRERSALGAITIAFALIAAGIAAALDASSGIALDLGATGVATIALLVIGLGLLVGTVWGRARWLALVALLVVPFVGVGVLVDEADDALGVDVDVSSGLGERRVTVDGDEALPRELDLLAGSIDVDLEDWEPSTAARAALDGDGADLRIDVGAGEVDITMPADVAWRVVTDIGLGEYRVRGDDVSISSSVESFEPFADEADTGERFVREGGPADGPVLDVAVDVGFGQVTIRETTPATGGDPADTDTEELS